MLPSYEAALKVALVNEFVTHPHPKRKHWGKSAFKMGWISGMRRGYPYRGLPTYSRVWLRGYLAYIEYEQKMIDNNFVRQIDWLTDNIDSNKFEHTSGSRMRAITMGWKPDWKKHTSVLDVEARDYLRAEVERVKEKQAGEWERYIDLRETLANRSPLLDWGEKSKRRNNDSKKLAG